jgi:hypothetical protein
MRAEKVGGDMPRQAEPAHPHDLGEMVWSAVSCDTADN